MAGSYHLLTRFSRSRTENSPFVRLTCPFTVLIYQGAFRLPDAPGTPDNVGWEWGGSAMTYYPQGDPAGPADGYPGSIYGAGHDQTQYISEISIPIPLISRSRSDLDILSASARSADSISVMSAAQTSG